MPVRIGVVVFPGSNCDRDTRPRARAGRRRAGRPVARAGLARRRRRGHPARRLRVRRLRARRRHRPVQPGHAGRRGLRGRGRPRPGHLQRLPGPRRGRARAGRAAAQRVAAVRRAGGADRGGAERHAVHPRWLDVGRPLRMPVAHGEGCYYADDATLDALEREARSCSGTWTRRARRPGPTTPANPNGSLRAIAGVLNAAGNVAGLMPHPERAVGGDPRVGRRRRRSSARSSRVPRERRTARRPARGRIRPAWARDDRGRATPWSRSIAALGRDRRGARRDPRTGSVGATRTTSSSRCSASCGASTARTRARSRCCGRCRPRGEGVVAGPGENAGVISIGDGLAVAFKIESHNHPSRGRAVPGRRDRRRRDPARHLHDGRAPDRRPRCAALRRPGGRPDAAPGRWRRARRRRLRQLRRRADGRRRARLRPDATRATRSSTSWPSACSRSGG